MRHGFTQGPNCPHENRYLRADAIEAAATEVVTSLLADGDLETLVRDAVEQRLDAARTSDTAIEATAAAAKLAERQSALDALTTELSRATTEVVKDSIRRRMTAEAAAIEELESRAAKLAHEFTLLERIRKRQNSLLKVADLALRALRGASNADRRKVFQTIFDDIVVDLNARTVELRVNVTSPKRLRLCGTDTVAPSPSDAFPSSAA